MNEQSISAIAAHGMEYERSRLELAALKISLANVTFSSLLDANSFAKSLNVGKEELVQDGALEVKSVMDQKNPKANAEGYVYRFSIDPTHEMASLVSATRAYEANVRAYNTNSQMNKAALEIGK